MKHLSFDQTEFLFQTRTWLFCIEAYLLVECFMFKKKVHRKTHVRCILYLIDLLFDREFLIFKYLEMISTC